MAASGKVFTQVPMQQTEERGGRQGVGSPSKGLVLRQKGWFSGEELKKTQKV